MHTQANIQELAHLVYDVAGRFFRGYVRLDYLPACAGCQRDNNTSKSLLRIAFRSSGRATSLTWTQRERRGLTEFFTKKKDRHSFARQGYVILERKVFDRIIMDIFCSPAYDRINKYLTSGTQMKMKLFSQVLSLSNSRSLYLKLHYTND